VTAAAAERILRSAVALVWLATGLLVVTPYYRAEGTRWLAPLGFGPWLMVATCAGEVVLAAVVLWRKTDLLQALAQTAPILAFSLILGALDPHLLAHPFGVLTKNIPIVASLWTAYLLGREGFTPRVDRLLRVAAGLIWITEGIFPKLLFQSPLEIAVLGAFGVPAAAASTLIRVTGVAQALSGVLVFALKGRALAVLLLLQMAALVFLPLLVTWTYPEMWAHPFGPMTKNVVIVAAAYVLWRRCTPTSS
jgi:hypothetical protein